MRGFVVLLLLAGWAQAGQTLKLRAGDVNARALSAVLLENSLAAPRTTSYIVQFKEKISDRDQRWLKSLGLRLDTYFPEDALLVKATASQVARVHADRRIQAVVPLLAPWRLDPELEPLSIFTKQVSTTVAVRLTSAEEHAEVMRALEGLPGVTVLTDSESQLVLQTSRQNLDRIAAIDGVLWIQPLPEMQLMAMEFAARVEPETPLSKLTGLESGTGLMNFTAAWTRGLTGLGQTVAVADTGLDTGDVKTLFADFGNFHEGTAFGAFSDSWGDLVGHGTHVAGSILGQGVGSRQLVRGGAYEARLIVQGMWSPFMGNLAIPPQPASFLQAAYDKGARIHSNSWGSARDLGVYDLFAQEVDEFVFQHPDLLIVFAAGNSGEDLDRDGRVDAGSISSPGTAKNVLTVGASENLVARGGLQVKLGVLNAERWGAEPIASDLMSNNARGLAAFSSRGPTRDGRLKPDVVAPGTNILSNCSHQKEASSMWGRINAHYCFAGGTSMATPLTAGAAAVVRQYLQTKALFEPSAALVKNVLMHTALDLYPGQFGEGGEGQELLTRRPDSHQGYGRVDVARATQLESTLIVDEKDGVAQDESRSYEITVGETGALFATLVYTDAPGAPNVSQSLVNDLDLQLTSNGEVVAQGDDRLNNTEVLTLSGLKPGPYKLLVRGFRVITAPQGRQPYALLVSP